MRIFSFSPLVGLLTVTMASSMSNAMSIISDAWFRAPSRSSDVNTTGKEQHETLTFRQAADQHVGIADRFYLVAIVRFETFVEFRVHFVENGHDLHGREESAN